MFHKNDDSNNNIVFELKEGKGYIKEYDILGKFIYEGEYMNGRKNGKGKEYNHFFRRHLKFEGEYINW